MRLLNNDYTKLNSVMAEHSHDRTSNKYSFVPTFSVINLLEKQGWVVSDARETNAKKTNGYQKHIIRLRKNEDLHKILEVDELIPEISLINSHDGGSSFQLSAGLFRCFCSNQCTVSDSALSSHRIMHKGFSQEKILDAVYRIVEDTPKIINRVKDYKNINLSFPEQAIFAQTALELLYPNEKIKTINMEQTVPYLLSPKRTQDKEKNLWNTYNVIQEKFTSGDRFLVNNNITNLRFSGRVVKKTKPIKSIDRDIKLNKSLWSLTERMAELKNIESKHTKKQHVSYNTHAGKEVIL